MAIQFRCAGCSQPIEVDDQYAGREAQCPYCRRVVTVPQQTTFDSSDAGAACPASGAAVPPIAGLPPLPEQGVPTTDAYWQPAPPAPPNPRVGSARRIGNIALVCAVLSVTLFVLATVLCTIALLPDWIRLNNQQPTPEQLNAMLTKVVTDQPIIPVALFAAFVSSLAGLILGIVTWRMLPAANWRAWVSVGLCAPFMLCMCGNFVLSFARA